MEKLGGGGLSHFLCLACVSNTFRTPSFCCLGLWMVFVPMCLPPLLVGVQTRGGLMASCCDEAIAALVKKAIKENKYPGQQRRLGDLTVFSVVMGQIR